MWEMKGFFSNLVDSVLDALEVVMHVAYETGKAVLWIGIAAALLVGFFAWMLEVSQHPAIAVRVLAWGLISLESLVIITVTLLLLRHVWRERPTRNGKIEAEQRAEREKIQSEYDRTHRYRLPPRCGGSVLPPEPADAAKVAISRAFYRTHGNGTGYKDTKPCASTYCSWCVKPSSQRNCVNCGLGLKNTRAQMNENGEPVHLNCSLTTGVTRQPPQIRTPQLPHRYSLQEASDPPSAHPPMSTVEPYSADANAAMRASVAEARDKLAKLKYGYVAEIADYTSVVKRYSTDADLEIREWVANALSDRGNAHRLRGDHAAAIADYTSVVESYSADADSAIRALVAKGREELVSLYRLDANELEALRSRPTMLESSSGSRSISPQSR